MTGGDKSVGKSAELTYGYFMRQPAVFLGGRWVTIGEIMAERDALKLENLRLREELGRVEKVKGLTS